MADNTEDYGYDLLKTIILAGTGIVALYAINKFFDLRRAPILLGGVTPETATKEISVNIPEIWIPYQTGDNKDSVEQKYTPNISIEGDSWVLKFNTINANVGGIITSYTPDPIKIPLTNTITLAELAVKLSPIVNYTANPVGWNIKFPPFTILA